MDYFKPNLIFLDYECDNFEDMVRKVVKEENVKSYIKDTFAQAIIDREKEYPTGLDFDTHTMAIPHTDPEHINEEGIVVIRTTKPIEFKYMGLGSELETSLILMLLVKNTGNQVPLLEKTMEVFSDGQFVQKLLASKSESEVYSLLKERYE